MVFLQGVITRLMDCLKSKYNGLKIAEKYNLFPDYQVSIAFITSNDRSFGYPIIYTDTMYNAILFIDTSTIFDTTKLIL